MRNLPDQQGAQQLIKQSDSVLAVACDAALIDLDTPADLQQLRAREPS